MENLVERVDEKARQKLSDCLETKSMVQLANSLGINRGLIHYVLEGGHSPTVLGALDMPVYEQRPVPVCMDCGKVHTMHNTCVEKRDTRVRFRKIAELDSKEDLEALDEFVKDSGADSWTQLWKKVAELHRAGFRSVVRTEVKHRDHFTEV